MARLPYPSRDTMPADVANLLRGLPRINITEMIAHAQSLIEPFLATAQANFTSLELSARQRELVILAVSGLMECDYEFVQHVPMFAAVGIDDDLRDRIRDGDFDAPDDPGERALLTLVAEVVNNPRVNDDVFSAARTHLSARQIVEVLQLVGFYWSIARTCTVLGLELDLPDGSHTIDAVARMNK